MLRQGLSSSYLNASEKDTKFKVWDNASTDQTQEFLEEFSSNNTNVSTYRSKHHFWMRAYGMAALSVDSEYVILSEDDILWHDYGYDKVLVDLMEANPDLGLITCNALQTQWGTHGRPAPWEAQETRQSLGYTLYVGPHLDTWFSITRRDLLVKLNGYISSPAGYQFHSSPGARYIGMLWGAGYKTAWVRECAVVHGSDVPWNIEFGCGNILKSRMEPVDWDYKIESMRRCPYLSKRFTRVIENEPLPTNFNEAAWQNLQRHIERLKADGDFTENYELPRRF